MISITENTSNNNKFNFLENTSYFSNIHSKDCIQNSDLRSKTALKEGILETLENNLKDHSIYFSTYTFENTFKQPSHSDFERFFHFHRRKIDSSIINDSNLVSHGQKTKIILIPENSYYHSNAPDHFHGFLLIHKNNKERFKRRCLGSPTIENTKAGLRPNCVFKSKFINPYPKSLLQDYKEFSLEDLYSKDTILLVNETRIYPIGNTSDLTRTSEYSLKNFSKAGLTYDDIIVV